MQAGPLYAFPLFGLLALAIAAVCLGIGRGALDDLVALAGGKVPTGGRRTLAERATVQAEVARAEAAVRAARALLEEAIGEAWERAVADGSVDGPAGRACGSPRRTRPRPACRPPRPRTGWAAAARSTTRARCSAACATRNVAAQHMLVAPATWELTGRAPARAADRHDAALIGGQSLRARLGATRGGSSGCFG